MYTLTARFFDGLFSLFKKINENLFEHVAFPQGGTAAPSGRVFVPFWSENG